MCAAVRARKISGFTSLGFSSGEAARLKSGFSLGRDNSDLADEIDLAEDSRLGSVW